MPDIPKHILDRAAEYHEAIVKDGPESAIHHIARAIVDENDACAEIAKETDAPPNHSNSWHLGFMWAATLAIPTAIRNRVTQEE